MPDCQPMPDEAGQHEPASSASDPDAPIATSTELLRGQRELLIRHDNQTYRLRLTASNKLILMK